MPKLSNEREVNIPDDIWFEHPDAFLFERCLFSFLFLCVCVLEGLILWFPESYVHGAFQFAYGISDQQMRPRAEQKTANLMQPSSLKQHVPVSTTINHHVLGVC